MLTSDEHRAAIFEAMAIARSPGIWTSLSEEQKNDRRMTEQRVFDSIHGLALIVNPDMFKKSHPWWHACLKDSDLTNPPEKKP